jgi:hypothetical protein
VDPQPPNGDPAPTALAPVPASPGAQTAASAPDAAVSQPDPIVTLPTPPPSQAPLPASQSNADPGSTLPQLDSFDLEATTEQWNRLQARLRFHVASWLLALGVVLLFAAAITWSQHIGYPPDSTTITVETKAGVEESRIQVWQTANPLIGLPTGLAMLGLIVLAPVVTWAIAPGSKVTGPGGIGAEGSPESAELMSARPKVAKAIDRTPPNVDRMIEATSVAVDQPPLPQVS